MASDARDPQLDKVLARHFRAPSDPAAAKEQTHHPKPDLCPDSELLAAYHESSLLPEEMSFWKQHMVECADCQTILADLERTDDLALGAVQDRAPQAVPALGRRGSSVLHGTRWKWLAPAGAIAATLLLWVAWRQESKSTATKSGTIELAKVQEPTAPLQQDNRTAARPAPGESESKPDSSRLGRAPLSARRDIIASAPASVSKSRIDLRGAQSGKKNDKQLSGSGAEEGAPAQIVEVQNAESARLEYDAAGLKKENDLKDQLSGTQSQNLNQRTANAPTVAGPAPLNQMAPDKTPKAKLVAPRTPPSPSPATGGYLDAGTASALEVVSSSDPGVILSSDRATSWRAGPRGLIEFSSDHGKTWTGQFSGVLTDLLTGAAPTASTCWIVGRLGTLIVTTDGGAHWRVVKIPITGDLGGVRATDSLHATIWDSRNTQYFQTKDGGLTWKLTMAP
jgi:hypothetical protein